LLQEAAGPVNIKLYNMAGVEVMSSNFDADQGTNHYEVDITRLHLPSGLYTMRFHTRGKTEIESINVIVK